LYPLSDTLWKCIFALGILLYPLSDTLWKCYTMELGLECIMLAARVKFANIKYTHILNPRACYGVVAAILGAHMNILCYRKIR
jgi:hypothetical protein